MRIVEQIWHGEGAAERIARAALFPFEEVYHGVVALRGNLFDRGLLQERRSTIPVISIGNLTVGGTGKTPVASWIASQLRNAGHNPAIVLRGYGEDEILVHRELNPGMSVVAAKDRVDGIRQAASEGADIAVLDDAFQHRRAARDADIVIISADSWSGRTRLLPAGPWREPLSAIRRASLVLITRKAATEEKSREVMLALERVSRGIPQAIARIRMSELVSATTSDRQEIAAVAGRKVLAVSAIGNPEAFSRQLVLLGAQVTPAVFDDHHAFSRDDVRRILTDSAKFEMVVCTLKDAVKLRELWPASGPRLWYVSQSIDVENGWAGLNDLLARFPAPE